MNEVIWSVGVDITGDLIAKSIGVIGVVMLVAQATHSIFRRAFPKGKCGCVVYRLDEPSGE